MSFTPPFRMMNFCPSGFCGPPCLICAMLKTEWWTLYTLGKRSTKWATCPALFCFLSTVLETQGFPHTEHKQQRLFCANKCVLLIADTPFHAKSVQWQVADRYCERACSVCRKQVLPVAGGGFRTPVLQHARRGSFGFANRVASSKRLGVSHSSRVFWGQRHKAYSPGGEKLGTSIGILAGMVIPVEGQLRSGI